MKALLILLLFAGSIACNQKEMAFRATATGPMIGLAKDTIRVREKDPNNLNGNGIFPLQALPVGHQLHLRFHDTSGHVRFSYRGQLLANDQPVIVAGEWNTLFCSTDTSGVFGVEVSLKDQLGRISYKQLVIDAARAQRPKAGLQWKVDQRDPARRRYYFDAGACEQPYGKVLTYHYVIGGQSIVTSVDQLQYIFHQRGSYPLSFFVKDDLGQHSDTIHQTIDVL